MTHLKIEQNNGLIEEVSSAVISKLYDIVHSGNLDNTSNLIGRLHTSATYQDYIDYLEDAFKVNGVKLLIIDATKKYLTFADPVVASYWANSTYGDGTGIDSTAANSVLSIPNDAFLNNTSLQTFNELSSSFINCSSLGSRAFCECTSLTSIDISNVTNISNQCFAASTALTTIGNFNTLITSIPFGCFDACTSLVINDLNLPNLTTLNPYSFKNTKVKLVSNLGSITSVLTQAFWGCSQLTSVILPNTVTTLGDGAFGDCSSLTSVGDLSNCTSIGNNAFRLCTSLTTIDLSNVTSISSDAFNGCTSLGLGQTLELNLTDLTYYPNMALNGTKYTRLILHSPQLLNTYDGRYPVYANMDLLLYLDLSDWLPAKASSNNSFYGDGSFYNNTSLVTFIAPITTNYISAIINTLGNYSNFRYLILLSTTPPGLYTTDSNNPTNRWFHSKSGNVHIYVPDSAKAAYLADADWSTIGGYNGSDTITDRLHGLSELPNGVWTTGLASQYLTPALLATS